MSDYGLFERFGVELEYMLVARDDLRVMPVCDRLLHAIAGAPVADVDLGPLSWSNELALHVVEFKTNGPAQTLSGLGAIFQEHVRRANAALAPLDAQLMPTAMHPWMNPLTETRLWPHECDSVYRAFDRIFDCRGHGWANLQSAHLNLPFCGEAQFGRLHAAIRVLLPLLPALAASSPICDGRPAGFADARLTHYQNNCRRIPLVTGRVIPEPVFTPTAYAREILTPMYQAIAPLDPAGTLQHEWLNARGAIPRFERRAIEIRVLDVQEHPAADAAILALVVAVLKALVDERWRDLAAQQTWQVAPLAAIFDDAIRSGDEALIANRAYLELFGLDADRCRAGELWAHLRAATLDDEPPDVAAALDLILERGVLARRIMIAVGPEVRAEALAEVYDELCRCLLEGRGFVG